MVWSHSSVTRGVPAPQTAQVWRRRQLGIDTARAIAAKGGVVGLWALAPDVGASIDDYAGRLLEMADWLGDEHVGFGTDINRLGAHASIKTYGEVRRVVEHWQARKVDERRIRRMAGSNYAGVLKAAMVGR